MSAELRRRLADAAPTPTTELDYADLVRRGTRRRNLRRGGVLSLLAALVVAATVAVVRPPGARVVLDRGVAASGALEIRALPDARGGRPLHDATVNVRTGGQVVWQAPLGDEPVRVELPGGRHVVDVHGPAWGCESDVAVAAGVTAIASVARWRDRDCAVQLWYGPAGGFAQPAGVFPVPEAGEVAAVTLDDGTPVFVIAHDDGTVGVVDALSTHIPDVGKLVAWCASSRTFEDLYHGSRFLPDGRYLSGPAPFGLASYETRVKGDDPAQVIVGALRPPPPRPPQSVIDAADIAGPPCAGPDADSRDMVSHRPDQWTPQPPADIAGDDVTGVRRTTGTFVSRWDQPTRLCEDPALRDGVPACAATAPVTTAIHAGTDQAGQWATRRYDPLLVRMVAGTIITPILVSDPDATTITHDGNAQPDGDQLDFARLVEFGWHIDGQQLTAPEGRFLQLQGVVVIHDGQPIPVDAAVPDRWSARDTGRPTDVSILRENATIVGREQLTGADEPTTLTIDELFAADLPDGGVVVQTRTRDGVIVSLEELPGQPAAGPTDRDPPAPTATPPPQPPMTPPPPVTIDTRGSVPTLTMNTIAQAAHATVTDLATNEIVAEVTATAPSQVRLPAFQGPEARSYLVSFVAASGEVLQRALVSLHTPAEEAADIDHMSAPPINSVATTDTVWLDWQDIPGADVYTLTRTGPDSDEPRQLGVTEASQFVDTTVTADRAYHYIMETKAATADGHIHPYSSGTHMRTPPAP